MANYQLDQTGEEVQEILDAVQNKETTRPVLNSSKLITSGAVRNALAEGYLYKGVADHTTNPGTPTEKVFYIASDPGTYSNFGTGISVAEGEVAILKYDTAWHKEVTGAATAAQVTELGQEVGLYDESVAVVAGSGFSKKIYGSFQAGDTIYISFTGRNLFSKNIVVRDDANTEMYSIAEDISNVAVAIPADTEYIEFARLDVPVVTSGTVTISIKAKLSAGVVAGETALKNVGEHHSTSKTTTSPNTSVVLTVPLKAGTHVFIDASVSALTMDFAVRAHQPSDNTYATLTSGARGRTFIDAVLVKDIDYIQLIRNSTAVAGLTATIDVYAGALAETMAQKILTGSLYQTVGWKLPKEWFEIGNLIPSTSGWSYSQSASRVRLGQGRVLHLKQGDIIGLTNYENRQFYLGGNINGTYITQGWNTADVTISQEGDYAFVCAYVVAQTIVDISEFSELVFVKRKDGLLAQSGDAGDGIPEYYGEYLDGKFASIRDNLLGVSGISDAFVFLTDAHWFHNPKTSIHIIHEIVKRGLSQKVVFGGDVCSAYTPTGESWIQPGEIQTQMNFNGLSRMGGRIYNVRGNHDFNGSKNNIVPGQPGSDNYSWPEAVARNLIASPMYNDGGVTLADGNAIYYFVDDPRTKIRYIIIYAIYASNFQADQAGWMIDALNGLPDGYDAIIFNHDGLFKTTSLDCWSKCPDAAEIVQAFEARSAGTTSTLSCQFDFSAAAGHILAVISGHVHGDLQTFIGGITNISVRCDADYSSGIAYLGEDASQRVIGTITEQCFDHIVLDKETGDIFCERIGAGGNRVFRSAIINLAISGTTALSSSLSGQLTWGSYDNDTDWYDGSYTTPAVPVNTRVSVAAGIVTGVASGQAVVYAKDANGNREFWNIVVA